MLICYWNVLISSGKICVTGIFAFCTFKLLVRPLNPQNSKNYSAPVADDYRDGNNENKEYGLKPHNNAKVIGPRPQEEHVQFLNFEQDRMRVKIIIKLWIKNKPGLGVHA